MNVVNHKFWTFYEIMYFELLETKKRMWTLEKTPRFKNISTDFKHWFIQKSFKNHLIFASIVIRELNHNCELFIRSLSLNLLWRKRECEFQKTQPDLNRFLQFLNLDFFQINRILKHSNILSFILKNAIICILHR